jgi:hypothetical protein
MSAAICGTLPHTAELIIFFVMAGLVPAIHVFSPQQVKTWMPGTRPGMTKIMFGL